MLEYKGRCGTAKVMTDNVDSATVSQIYEFLNHEAFTNPVVVMPDCHKGNGAVIGFTMEMTDMVIPNVVGVDINCGMNSFNVGKNVLAESSRKDIDEAVRATIPFGTNVHRKTTSIDRDWWKSVRDRHRLFVMKYNKRYNTSYGLKTFNDKWLQLKCDDIGMDFTRVIRSIGTLGGGNHFIELGKSQLTGDYWFTVHSGSRQFGLKICNFWQRKAGKGALAYLTGDDMFGYLSDMIVAQMYAELNRHTMVNLIIDSCRISWDVVKQIIYTNHNFIDFDDFIIRKGAIRSYVGEYMIIPFNMEDGILLCSGRSNPEWNFSAPHGAGRVASRSWAKKNLNLEETKHRMEQNDIYFSRLPKDELKGAYKDPKVIEEAIEPTAMIVDRFKPVLVMKE